MKYQCKICGYIYDEEKEGKLFKDLPSDWTCPLCGASKNDFELIGKKEESSKKTSIVIDKDMQKLSIGQLAALCSSLSKGCEKQYKAEEAALYRQLSLYFSSIEAPSKEEEIKEILNCINDDLEVNFNQTVSIAKENQDRGTQRACVWSEKVTRILNQLLNRYEKEGEDLLKGKDVYICTVCGFVFIGQTPPELCPVCKVPSWKFEKIEGRD